MAATRKSRKLEFDNSNNSNCNIRQRFTVSSTPIKSDDSGSPPSSAGSAAESCEKFLEITEASGPLRDLILNLEDLSEDVYELKENFLEQNIRLGQYLASIDSKLDTRNRQTVEEQDEAEEEEDGVERCNSFVFKKKSNQSSAEVPDEDEDEASSSDDDSDYPDVMNISRSLNSMLGSVTQQDGSFMQEVGTIEEKLEKFQRYLQTQKTEIVRLELIQDALLMQNERMMKNQKKLEEEQSVTVKIIQSKDQEISLLKSRLVNEFEDDGLGLLLAAGRDLQNNLEMHHDDIVKYNQKMSL